ncbi:hypothetical protein C5Y97_30695 [Blastopirellula marina]|uniref:Uncharacterized protein n=1 Tax=Blastopirellula marina TaxID=124 RepID=A0A2S8F317_9BACT|nr:hypothetical protein C5Y98_30680 [Blastopirellula marina]PTL40820.1 hypothetical protein C5Y97_30695 [Blastopirellula marina]
MSPATVIAVASSGTARISTAILCAASQGIGQAGNGRQPGSRRRSGFLGFRQSSSAGGGFYGLPYFRNPGGPRAEETKVTFQQRKRR